jgi:hypothetical protein
MSINQADQAIPADAAPLLRTLGDPAAAVCTDGFCAVPPGAQAAPDSAATTGADA